MPTLHLLAELPDGQSAAAGALQAEIRYLVEQAKSLECVQHAGTHGTLNELFLSDLIAKILPAPISACSGLVIDATGFQSTQMDIIIYDSRVARPFVRGSGVALCAWESVLATIEVKSTLETPKQIKLSAASALRLRNNATFAPGFPYARIDAPKHAFFAFQGRCVGPRSILGGDESKCKTWLRTHAGPLWGICVVDALSWIIVGGNWAPKQALGAQPFAETLRFLAILVDSVRDLAEKRWDRISLDHYDLIGAYIRPRPH